MMEALLLSYMQESTSATAAEIKRNCLIAVRRLTIIILLREYLSG